MQNRPAQPGVPRTREETLRRFFTLHMKGLMRRFPHGGVDPLFGTSTGYVFEELVHASGILPENTDRAKKIETLLLSALHSGARDVIDVPSFRNPDRLFIKLRGRHITFLGLAEIKMSGASIVARGTQLLDLKNSVVTLVAAINGGRTGPEFRGYRASMAADFSQVLVAPQGVEGLTLLMPEGWTLTRSIFTLEEIYAAAELLWPGNVPRRGKRAAIPLQEPAAEIPAPPTTEQAPKRDPLEDKIRDRAIAWQKHFRAVLEPEGVPVDGSDRSVEFFLAIDALRRIPLKEALPSLEEAIKEAKRSRGNVLWQRVEAGTLTSAEQQEVATMPYHLGCANWNFEDARAYIQIRAQLAHDLETYLAQHDLKEFFDFASVEMPDSQNTATPS